MNCRAACRTVSQIATPKNNAASPLSPYDADVESGASRGVFIIPRKRDKNSGCRDRAKAYNREKGNGIYLSILGRPAGFQDILSPGVSTYAVTVRRGSVWGLDFYQCARDMTSLENLLSAVKVTYLIDYQPVSEKALLIFRSYYNSWTCQGWTTSLSEGEHAKYEFAILYEYDRGVSDGEN